MKIMTYNVHSCIDGNKKNSLNRIADLIRAEKIAIAGFNEIESWSPRTWFANQPRKLAASRDMSHCFGPAIKLGPIGFFGNAVLSRYPIISHQTIKLPVSAMREPRCCIVARLRIPEGYVTVISTHLGLNHKERKEQIDQLVRMVRAEKNPVILMGDFNCGTGEITPLYEVLTDTGASFGSKPTYPSDKPVHRIDYILVSPEINCQRLYVPENDASDHLPVIAELKIQ